MMKSQKDISPKADFRTMRLSRVLPDVFLFLEVARQRNISRAAINLNMVQSNVTARVRKLEEALGAKLFYRHARGVRLTVDGDRLLATALRLESVADELRELSNESTREPAALRLGSIETVAAVHLTQLVANFVKNFPGTDVSVETASSEVLLKKVRNWELDGVFVSRRTGYPDLFEEVAFSDELVILAPETISSFKDLKNSRASSLKLLAQRFGCSYTQRLVDFLAQHKITPAPMLELGTLEGIVGFVEAGVGIATLPASFVQSVASGRPISLFHFPKRTGKVDTYFVALQRNLDSPALSRFRRTLRKGPGGKGPQANKPASQQ